MWLLGRMCFRELRSVRQTGPAIHWRPKSRSADRSVPRAGCPVGHRCCSTGPVRRGWPLATRADRPWSEPTMAPGSADQARRLTRTGRSPSCLSTAPRNRRGRRHPRRMRQQGMRTAKGKGLSEPCSNSVRRGLTAPRAGAGNALMIAGKPRRVNRVRAMRGPGAPRAPTRERTRRPRGRLANPAVFGQRRACAVLPSLNGSGRRGRSPSSSRRWSGRPRLAGRTSAQAWVDRRDMSPAARAPAGACDSALRDHTRCRCSRTVCTGCPGSADRGRNAVPGGCRTPLQTPPGPWPAGRGCEAAAPR